MDRWGLMRVRGYLRPLDEKGTRWQAVVYVQGTRLNGKRREQRITRVFRGSKREAQRELAQLLVEVGAGRKIPPTRRTLVEALADWLQMKRDQLKPRTWERYEEILRCHLPDELGQTPLHRLTPESFEEAYAQLTPARAFKLHAVLRPALKWFRKRRYIGENPLKLVEAPRWRPKRGQALTPEQAQQVLDALWTWNNGRPHRLYAFFALALSTGLRTGELAGLRWLDVDARSRILLVRQTLEKPGDNPVFGTPKTEKGVRVVALGRRSAAVLRWHRMRQRREMAHWKENRGLVFTATDGSPLDLSNVRDDLWLELRKKLGLEGVRLHDLRHTQATALSASQAGVDVSVIAARLGHSEPATTLRYIHPLSPESWRAAEVSDRLLFGGRTRRRRGNGPRGQADDSA